jgi:microbial collagenase
MFTPLLLGRGRWLCATLAAASITSLPLPAQALSPSAQLAQRQLQRESLLPADPGVPRLGSHIGKVGLPPALLPLRRADDFVPRRQAIGETIADAKLVLSPRAKAARAKRLAPTGASCSGSDFVGRSGSGLIAFIDAADLSGCMYSLYSGSVDEYRSVFSDANIITVANELKLRAQSYTGNDSNHSMNLLSFLRTAGYWSFMSTTGDPWNNIPPGSPQMMSAALGGLMQIVASPYFFDQTEDNAFFVSEVYKTAPSGFSLSFAPSAKGWVDRVTPATPSVGYWTNEAITAAMGVFYNGPFQPDYVAAVQGDVSYATSFNAFLTRNRPLTGTTDSYHLANAMGELIRFVQFAPQSAQVRGMASAQMSYYPVTQDSTIDVWMRASSTVDEYDSANCAVYGTCNGQDTVAALKLPIRYACGTQYVIRSEAMTAAQLDSTCTSITQETKYFHGLLGTRKNEPVAGDRNKTLELVVFDNYSEYARFSGFLFGNSTNNGGIYLEGDPSLRGNQARFIAYRADWLSTFEIWNLNHEFAHYLDGRYDMWGGFGDYPLEVGGSGPVHQSSVWWIEGFAEYMSYSFRERYYADATSRAQIAPLALSDVMRNTYDSGSARVYNWGYLAARYIIERQPPEQKTFLPMMRVGNYAGYSSYIDQLGSSLDGDFSSWLQRCVSGGDTHSKKCISKGQGTKPLLDPSAIGPCQLGSDSALANGCSRSLTNGGVLSYYIRMSDWPQAIFRLSQVAGSVDLYAKADGWPTTSDYDLTGHSDGQDLSLTLPAGTSGWSYVMAVPRGGFSAATLRGMYSPLPFPEGSLASPR